MLWTNEDINETNFYKNILLIRQNEAEKDSLDKNIYIAWINNYEIENKFQKLLNLIKQFLWIQSSFSIF